MAADGSPLARWRGIFRIAARQLRQRWLESVLIVLGISLGVGVFTTTETLLRFLLRLEGALTSSQQLMSAAIRPMKLDLGELARGGSLAVFVPPDLMDPVQLGLEDLYAIRRDVSDLEYAAARDWTFFSLAGPRGGEGDAGVPIRSDREIGMMMGTPDTLPVEGFEIIAGRNFTWEEFENGEPRLVLIERFARTLFPGKSADEVVGETITTSNFPSDIAWQVIGVAAPPSSPFNLIGGLEVHAFAPITANREAPELTEIIATPKADATLEELTAALQAYMDSRHGPGRVEVQIQHTGPTVSGPDSNVPLMLMLLSSLALVIAAINILNLFTARVLRRRRLAGMALALGATRPLLFWQTCGEAFLLGLGGGIAGLGLAAGGTAFVRSLFIAQSQGFEPVIEIYSQLALQTADALIGLGIALTSALLFGLYPAWLSAAGAPAESLRSE